MTEKEKAFTEEQPIEGETVLICVHEAVSRDVYQGPPGDFPPNPNSNVLHFFRDRSEFIRPDGSEAVATWVAICTICYEEKRYNKPGGQFLIGGDCTWTGNAPVIRKD